MSGLFVELLANRWTPGATRGEEHLEIAPREGGTVSQMRNQRPPAPTHLRGLEDGAHPVDNTGQAITVNWTPASQLLFAFNVTQKLDRRAVSSCSRS